MGPIGIILCWKFLESVSAVDTPASFVQFYETTRASSDQIGINCSPESTIPSETITRERMMDVLERFDKKKVKTLPSFGNSLIVNGEMWHLSSLP
jgi:hypothetical protein